MHLMCIYTATDCYWWTARVKEFCATWECGHPEALSTVTLFCLCGQYVDVHQVCYMLNCFISPVLVCSGLLKLCFYGHHCLTLTFKLLTVINVTENC